MYEEWKRDDGCCESTNCIGRVQRADVEVEHTLDTTQAIHIRANTANGTSSFNFHTFGRVLH